MSKCCLTQDLNFSEFRASGDGEPLHSAIPFSIEGSEIIITNKVFFLCSEKWRSLSLSVCLLLITNTQNSFWLTVYSRTVVMSTWEFDEANNQIFCADSNWYWLRSDNRIPLRANEVNIITGADYLSAMSRRSQRLGAQSIIFHLRNVLVGDLSAVLMKSNCHFNTGQLYEDKSFSNPHTGHFAPGKGLRLNDNFPKSSTSQ